jgi:Rrf2 family protein
MLSQTVEYALRAMSRLAGPGSPPASSRALARATRVPQSYLSKIMRDLVQARLVRSFRGPNGGFVLARDAAAITVLDIVNAVDPIRRTTACPLDDPAHTTLCPLHRCLDDVLAQIERTFGNATLAAVTEQRARIAGHEPPEPA